jgi:hypothetical protein
VAGSVVTLPRRVVIFERDAVPTRATHRVAPTKRHGGS